MKINEVNTVWKDLCVIYRFIFIDNANIINSDICDDLPPTHKTFWRMRSC